MSIAISHVIVKLSPNAETALMSMTAFASMIEKVEIAAKNNAEIINEHQAKVEDVLKILSKKDSTISHHYKTTHTDEAWSESKTEIDDEKEAQATAEHKAVKKKKCGCFGGLFAKR